ncbi:MAG: hypothetical protein LBJ31_08660 [Treponema sp.]|jgi:hypothetical protein|nr:hypothetical protein [Treponema sp.]
MINRKTERKSLRDIAVKYRTYIKKLSASLPELAGQVQTLVDRRDGPSYTVLKPVVYNEALDEKNALNTIRMILVADNPGRREQEQGRYLVGPSGKIAEKFFRDNPELGIDFRKNVLVLNKTPIHTPRTGELKELCRIGAGPGKGVCAAAVESSQKFMADLLHEFWQSCRRPVWIIGYSEMKKGGIFEAYTEKLKCLCASNPAFKKSIFFYRHFSMNQFTIDLRKQAAPCETPAQTLERIGEAYRRRVLGQEAEPVLV